MTVTACTAAGNPITSNHSDTALGVFKGPAACLCFPGVLNQMNHPSQQADSSQPHGPCSCLSASLLPLGMGVGTVEVCVCVDMINKLQS